MVSTITFWQNYLYNATFLQQFFYFLFTSSTQIQSDHNKLYMTLFLFNLWLLYISNFCIKYHVMLDSIRLPQSCDFWLKVIIAYGFGFT